jgi:hypothetical protein
MSQDSVPSVLILYSNPDDSSSRLRLDKEHRAIEEMLRRLRVEPAQVQRRHAVSIPDFASAVTGETFEVLQFSGHGCEEGIFLEQAQLNTGELVDAQRLAAILRSATPSLRVLIFMSCFSASSLKDLASAAPYVITVSGEADDEACIAFITAFYEEYLRTRSVGRAFQSASNTIEFFGASGFLHPVLTRRALRGSSPEGLHAAAVRGDSVLVDLSAVEPQLRAAGMYNEAFLSFLSRKLRVHKWIFDQPRDRTLLSIGPYFGEFSWANADDAIRCLRVLRIREGVDEEACIVWADLLISYNDLYASRYRKAANPAGPESERVLKRALEDQRALATHFFGERAEPIQKAAANQYKVTKALVLANLRHATAALDNSQLDRVVVYLEASLTAIHDLIDALSEYLAEPVAANPDATA